MKVYIGNKSIELITSKNNPLKIIGDEPPIPVSQVKETRIGYSTITSGSGATTPYGLTNNTTTNNCKTK